MAIDSTLLYHVTQSSGHSYGRNGGYRIVYKCYAYVSITDPLLTLFLVLWSRVKLQHMFNMIEFEYINFNANQILCYEG